MSETGAVSPVVVAKPSAPRVSAGKIVVGVLVVLLVLVAVGAGLVYQSEERSLADSRQASAALTTQLAQSQQELAQSQQETRDRQADLDGTRQQLAQSQAETASAQANGKTLADQLAKSQQQTQQAEARVTGLQGEKDSLSSQVAMWQNAADSAQSKNTSLGKKMTTALARAQLVDQFVRMGTTKVSAEEKQAMTLRWLTALAALGDPKVDAYLRAFVNKPTDSTPLSQLLGYLSASVVDGLK